MLKFNFEINIRGSFCSVYFFVCFFQKIPAGPVYFEFKYKAEL